MGIEFFAIADGNLEGLKALGLLGAGSFQGRTGIINAFEVFGFASTVGEHFLADIENFLVLSRLGEEFRKKAILLVVAPLNILTVLPNAVIKFLMAAFDHGSGLGEGLLAALHARLAQIQKECERILHNPASFLRASTAS